MTRFAAFGWLAACVAALVVPACTQPDAHPAELGDCIPTNDAGCSPPVTGSSGAGGPGSSGEGGASESGGGDTGTASCGAAENVIGSGTQNTTCVPCIETSEPNGCCAADTACSQQSDCLALLTCIVACSAGDTLCAGNCENTYPAGVTSYDDLASCVDSACSGCPPLPQGVIGDF